MSYAIVATARNEGPFLLEWLAHHFAIGFDKIIVATNECEDGTDQLLDLVSSTFPVTRIDNSVPIDGLTHQRSAVRRGLMCDAIEGTDWVLHIDLDEFLNIQAPDPNVHQFMMDFQDYDAVMLCWKLFGDNNRSYWDGGSVLDGFHRCQDDYRDSAQKAFFRRSVFSDAAPHTPKSPTKPLSDLKIVDTRKESLPAQRSASKRGTGLGLGMDSKTWRGGCINHYVHKSRDLTRLGLLARGDANGRVWAKPSQNKRLVGSIAYNKLNRNDVIDRSIQASRDKRIAILNQLKGIPGVLEAHYAAQRWFMDMLIALNEEHGPNGCAS